ncbi:curli assembly protein CsgF [Sphingomonas sp. IC-56]|uniref:curli assembly protein CsgF n=1 Tax=Sphingomonas sp. IC-56 TaxID=2898529 RepID=UPI001E5FF29D|nr:curli assembly protein CsgF [Sphingomonas sp. IC-56]MCD2324434.1 curli assembly protein CsgF [Sphingomonas sp. IC-56]
MRRFLRVGMVGFGLFGMSNAASAQEIVQRFVNPGFGGNPFNSDYLLGTATPQRPERKTEGSAAEELTEAQLFARQIQSRLLSALSSSLVEAITGSQPGTSGEFIVGDQTIGFERTLTEIRLTIRDNTTGEVTTIAVPTLNFNNNAGGASAAAPGGQPGRSAESLIAGMSAPGTGASFDTPLTGKTGSLETPLTGGF